MQKTGNYITSEKKIALEAELNDLQGPKRKEVLEALKAAKALGDLSENAEYHQAREDQGRLESRIAEIEQILRSSEVVVEGERSDTVTIGSRVVIVRSGEKEGKNYTIVGSEESDMAQGKISNISPLGLALFGKKRNEEIFVETPGGKTSYKIIEVA